ncbi:hypothetical protein V8C44DRAFT_303527 [Trichoderma aethiopicum]
MKPNDMNAEKDTKNNRSRMIGVFGLDFDRRIRALGENQGNPAKYGLEHSSVSVRGLPSLHLQNSFYSFYFLCFSMTTVSSSSDLALVLFAGCFPFLPSFFSRLFDYNTAFNYCRFELAHHRTHFGNASSGRPTNSLCH